MNSWDQSIYHDYLERTMNFSTNFRENLGIFFKEKLHYTQKNIWLYSNIVVLQLHVDKFYIYCRC